MPENQNKSISIYINQAYLDALDKIAAEREVAGRKPSISQLISEAVDAFIESLKEQTAQVP